MTEPGKADLLRSRAFGWAGIVGPLVLGLGFALILAYQALDAARGHRAAAQATVRDHAEFAAYLLASRVERRLTRARRTACSSASIWTTATWRWTETPTPTSASG